MKRKIEDTALWVFGYGSLIWRPDLPFVERRVGFIRGWIRRFYQASHDHRGVPGAPGRVVTLLPQADGVTWGAAYRIDPNAVDDVLVKLDHREKDGYQRDSVDFFEKDGEGPSLHGVLVYRATENNPSYLGPAELAEMAAQIARSEGPSGTNREYLLNLAQALREINISDDHIEDLAAALHHAETTASS